MKGKVRSIVFNATRWVVMNYFREDLEMIEGSGSMKGRPIGWRWAFYDPEWEKKRYSRKSKQ